MAVVTPCLVLQNSSHPADRHRQWMRYLHGNRGGVVSGGLVVTQNGTPNMSVNVADGMCLVPGTENSFQGHYVVENQGTLNVAIGTSDPTNPRRDLVIARVRDAVYSGASNVPTIEVVQGTPAASPADPALPAGSCWVLYRVAVGAAVSTILNANLTRFAEGGTGYTGQNGSAAALGGIIVATSGTRPTAGLYEGLGLYETDNDRVMVYDGSAWGEASTGVRTVIGASSPMSTSFALVTGASLSLPAGKWVVMAKGTEVQTGTGAQYDCRIRNTTDSTDLDAISIYGGTGPQRLPWAMMGAVTLAGTKTIRVEHMVGALSATQTTDNTKLWAMPVLSSV